MELLLLSIAKIACLLWYLAALLHAAGETCPEADCATVTVACQMQNRKRSVAAQSRGLNDRVSKLYTVRCIF